MDAMWRIRSKNGKHLPEFLELGVIAIHFESADLTTATNEDDVRERFRAASVRAKPDAPRMAWMFRHRMSEGDIVLTPTGPRGPDCFFHIGRVLGDYVYDEAMLPGLPHYRKVRWADGRIPYESFGDTARGSLDRRDTLIALVGDVAAEIHRKLDTRGLLTRSSARETDAMGETQTDSQPLRSES